MFKAKLTGITAVKRKLASAVREYQLINISDVLEPVVAEIRSNLLSDWLNDPPPHRDEEEPFMHFVTGDLYRSVRVEPTYKRGSIEANFGYFIEYGLNLETGGPTTDTRDKEEFLTNQQYTGTGSDSSVPYPIIQQVWEIHRLRVKKDILDAVVEKFKEGFNS